MIYVYQNPVDALALWDALDDESSIYIAVIAGQNGEKSKVFAETEVIKGRTKRSCVRVFINKDEAAAYKASLRLSGVSVAKTTMGSLFEFMNKNFRYAIDTDWECILSTLDMDGKFYGLDLLWTNYQLDN